MSLGDLTKAIRGNMLKNLKATFKIANGNTFWMPWKNHKGVKPLKTAEINVKIINWGLSLKAGKKINVNKHRAKQGSIKNIFEEITLLTTSEWFSLLSELAISLVADSEKPNSIISTQTIPSVWAKPRIPTPSISIVLARKGSKISEII